jgi:hypothetical protein
MPESFGLAEQFYGSQIGLPTAWLEPRLSQLQNHPGPTLLTGSLAWGAAHLAAGMAVQPRSVWLWLEPWDAGDAVAQGNQLAEAVKRALGNSLFGFGLPYTYGLSVLRRNLDVLGPFQFIVSGADHAPELVAAILEFHRQGQNVLLTCDRVPPGLELPPNTLVMGPEDLRVTEAEAELLIGNRLPKVISQQLIASSGGALEPLLDELHRELGLTVPDRPSPSGPRLTGVDVNLEPEMLLERLIKQERWLEAIELTAQRWPTQVGALLERVEGALWSRGTPTQLFGLLSGLPSAARASEAVLRWQLETALDLGRETEVLPEVEAWLEKAEAPALRAVYAEARSAVGDSDGYQREAERAVNAAQTPQTLHQFGRALGGTDPVRGREFLLKALRLAEMSQDWPWAARSAEGLAARLNTLGEYRSAAHWAEWGLRLYDTEGLGRAGLRLRLLNEWAFARILIGDTTGLESQLRPEIEYLKHVRPAVARLLGSTLGDLLLCEGRAAEAAEVFQELWNGTTRRQAYGALAFDLVRSQIEIGQFQRAFDMAEHALQVTEGLPLVSQRKACLAWGVALSMVDPARSISVLEPLVHDFTTPLVADKRAQAALYLACARLNIGDRAGAKRALETVEVTLSSLGERSLRYLVGPESAFREVFSLLRGESAPLELRGLGQLEARLDGQPVVLRKRFSEILAVLALHPEGLNGEQLSIAVYGETADPQSCKADLSKLRGLVPIAQKPYRLGMGIWADFLEFQNMLSAGRVREAMALYRGPLLPGSDAPMIVEHRELLEEGLRQAVLASGDQEVLLDLAERQRDDLELWEAALELLAPGDPRWAQVQARTKQLGRNW